MTQWFSGEEVYKIDTKGRVSIPADFRAVLVDGDLDGADPRTPSLMIHYGPAAKDRRLECYTMQAFKEVTDKLKKMPRGSPRRRALEGYFHGQSQRMTVDETGRLVLPQKLREMIGLEREVCFVAAADTFNIWKPEDYEQEKATRQAEIEDLVGEGVDPLSLLEEEGI
ncbi:MraZ protein [Aliiruegeria haliotis]|uniref:Transcriptional regulator MraZ n=1 Tax=Aliiruegeria haliotis TaxID=1280846 RepID=A0A2T0RXW3_9RHOB|nr:division/cell wall cluster transcriptional repressor MraZ [Aliiruegeria haliotis]PRY25990.1 MraZ protein [Aliiruegeria haliotis]